MLKCYLVDDTSVVIKPSSIELKLRIYIDTCFGSKEESFIENKEIEEVLKKYFEQYMPPSNVIKLFLEDKIWVVIRPSENEPKIKYYKNLWKR